MELFIKTDSKKVLNTFKSIIENEKQSLDFNPMYVYFICKQDFIEHIYKTIAYVSWNNTSLDKIVDWIVIETWSLERKKRYNESITLDAKYFTYQ